jgi:asparagine N-glycosylation enzyme membrane subunit Stt3
VLATAVVLAAAANFHYVRLISFLAVLAAVLAVLLGRTIARPMLAFVRDFVSHDSTPALIERFSLRGIGYGYARRDQSDRQD